MKFRCATNRFVRYGRNSKAIPAKNADHGEQPRRLARRKAPTPEPMTAMRPMITEAHERLSTSAIGQESRLQKGTFAFSAVWAPTGKNICLVTNGFLSEKMDRGMLQ